MEKLDAIIIGSGFSGIYQLYSLRDKLGLKAKVLDAASGVGGTWFWNRYPGARCDSESHTYMYYFSKDLVNEWFRISTEVLKSNRKTKKRKHAK